MKKTHWISTLCVLVALLISLAVVSYSWLKRDWRPRFEESNIKVQTSSTLAIMLDKDGTTTELLTLNDILDTPEEFELKQVSSFTGKSEDFFGLYFQDGITLEGARIQHLESNEAEKNGYVQVDFHMIADVEDENTLQYVYLDPDSGIEVPEELREAYDGDPELRALYDKLFQALRISISSMTSTNGERTSGIKKTDVTHTGIAHYQDQQGNYVAEGKNPESTETIQFTNKEGTEQETVIVLRETNSLHFFRTFEDYEIEGLPSVLEGSLTPEQRQKTLFAIKKEESVPVTLRIWLEGTSEGCTEEISGLEFDLKIIFKGVVANKDESQ